MALGHGRWLYGEWGVLEVTSVALTYARQHLAEVEVAWRFTADDSTVVEAEFGELAAELGVRDIVDTRDPVASVHAMLATYPAEWMLIFDNAPDQPSIERFLPSVGPGLILITSQNPNWPHGQAIEVRLLDPEAAADFVITRTGAQDRQAAQELVGVMDRLPLALEQAAAYILATMGTLSEYLELFRRQRAEILRRGEPTGYPGTVATTWALAFSQLEESSSAAVGLLRLLAFCAPDAIPLRLLLQPRPGLAEELRPGATESLTPLLTDPLAAKDAIAALRRYSLVSPAAEGSASVHRLVQAVTAGQMSAALAETWRQATAMVISAAIPEDTEQPDNWSACAALLPHVQTAVPADGDATAKMAAYLSGIGNFSAARDLQQKAAAACVRILGREHPRTFDAQSDLANWTGLAGDAAGARDQQANLLSSQQRVLDPEDPHILATRANLAHWTGEAGEAARSPS